MIKRMRYEIVLEAVSPIAHHAGTTGNHSFLMTSRVRTARGFEDVPCITADTMRHKLREASSLALLDAAGMTDGGLTESALRLLFNGGMVTGSDGGAVKLDAYRELVELVPALGLFGGCAQNRIIPGRLTVDDALLICEETEHYLSSWQVDAAKRLGDLCTYSAHVEEAQRVRMDAALNPAMRKLLTDGEQVKIAGRLAASEGASEHGDAIEKESTKSAMLPRTFERIARGSLFGWSVEAVVQSELDEDVFNVAVLAFLSRAVVGGKGGTGHGQLRVVAANEVKMASPAREHEAFDTAALGLKVGQLFKQHVEQRRDRIREFFGGVSA
jgi:hypothetical protein